MLVNQIAYATWDIEETARSLAETEGVGPFFTFEFPMSNLNYRGKTFAHGVHRTAFGYLGDLQYEICEAPKGIESCYGEVLSDRRERFHHVYASSDEDFDALVARYASVGDQVAYSGDAGENNIRFAYVDATARLGHFIELLETRKMTGPATVIYDYYRAMKAAAEGWDGQRPVRSSSEISF